MSDNYQKKAAKGLCALWKIECPGHCNVAELEKLSALRALEDWKAGKEVLRKKNATQPIPDLPSTARKSGSESVGRTSHVNGSWGNIMTTFVQSDLKALKADLKDTLEVKVGE
jgi:hypothetical protein